MIKKALLVVGGVTLVSVVLFGRDACSYLTTSYDRITNTVQDNVPVGFQIDRARKMVQDLEPEIRRSMHVIAKEEVELEKLNREIGKAQATTEKDKGEILRLQSDLQTGKDVFRYAKRSYTAEEVRADLVRRFNRFKVADDTLTNLTGMRDARQRNLDAAREQLASMINARRQLDIDIQNLEAKQKLVDVAKATSDYKFDDTQLTRAKSLISDIRTRLDVQAKLANADVDIEIEIPLEDEMTLDITDQVAEYFDLQSPEETEFAAASYSIGKD